MMQTNADRLPIQFDLQGEDVELHYFPQPSNCRPTLAGKIAGLGVSCSGGEIEVHESPIGTLFVMTTLVSDRLGRRRRFAVLVPRIRGDKDVYELATLGISIVDHETEIGNRDRGVLTSYAAVKLVGTARTASAGGPSRRCV